VKTYFLIRYAEIESEEKKIGILPFPKTQKFVKGWWTQYDSFDGNKCDEAQFFEDLQMFLTWP